MNIDGLSLEEMLIFAIKGEVEAGKIYTQVANDSKNLFLKDRLEFLAREELKHRAQLEAMYEIYFPNKEIVLPDSTPVPRPRLNYDPANPISDILELAMEAEKATQEFYMAMAELMEDKEARVTMMYLAAMEGDHYAILESELKFYEGMNEQFE